MSIFISTAVWNLPHPPHPCCSDFCSGLVDQELLVLLRPEETTEWVFLHQGEDPLLGQVEGGRREIHQVPQGHILGEVVNVDLWWEDDRVSCQKWRMNGEHIAQYHIILTPFKVKCYHT